MDKQILNLAVTLLILSVGALSCAPPATEPVTFTVSLNGNPITAQGEINGGTTSPGTPLVLTFTVTNTSATPLSLPAGNIVTITGDNFTLDTDLPDSVPAGESKTFQVTFTSSSAGDFSGGITISNGTEVLFTFTLNVTCAPDVTAPAGYGVSIDDAYINNDNRNNFAFTLASAEVGTICHYSIDDTNAGTPAIIGSFTVTSANQHLGSIDVTSLDDDLLTFSIYLKDAADNTGSNVTDTVTKDTVAPVPGTGPAASGITQTSIDLNWAEGSDTITFQNSLQYKVVSSLTDNLNTVEDTNGAAVVQDWTTNALSATASSLTPSTTYYFNVLIRDEAGNTALYTAVNATTANPFPLGYVARWGFDGNANDELGNYNLFGPVSYNDADFKVGTYSLVLNGSSNYLSLLAFPFGASGLGLSSFSISSWVYLNSGATGQPTVFYWDGLRIYYDTATGKFHGDLKEAVPGNDVVTTGTYTTDTWHHVVLTFDAVTDALTLYIDNTADGTGTSALDRSGDDPQVLYIGTKATSGTFWNGKIDDILLYGRVLTPTEVGEIFLF